MKTVFALLSVALVACGSKSPPPAAPHETTSVPSPPATTEQPAPPAAPPSNAKADALAAETAAYEKAKPVFVTYCAPCHSKDGAKSGKAKLEHFDIDTYPFGGEHTAFIGDHIADVLGLSGKKPIMPKDKPGSVKGEDLALIKAWVDAWGAAEKAGAHPPHGEDPDKD